jgi:hypothetical protein
MYINWFIIVSLILGLEKLKLMRNWRNWERERMPLCSGGRVGMLLVNCLVSFYRQLVNILCVFTVASMT